MQPWVQLPLWEERPGELVGRRVAEQRFCGNCKVAYESSTMLLLPDCPALAALSATFACSIGSGLIESWVNSVTGNPDRSKCSGSTAVTRAMKKLDIKAQYCEDMRHDGELRIVDGHLMAFIPSNDGRSLREFFTLAHELGHAALHVLDPEIDQSGPAVERLCNLFAAELLMPTKIVHMICQEAPSADAIVKLARRTSSSLQASCVRIAEYLGSATAGLASPDGAVVESYGAKLTGSHRNDLASACKIASAGRSLMILQDKLIVSTRTIDSRRVVFLMRNIRNSEKDRLWQDAGRPRPARSDVRGHAFLSYVRDDSKRVNWLQHRLEAAGVQVWRDTSHLWPGEDWRAEIRQAIQDNALAFLACFSKASLARGQSYQNEEITLAIEQLRRRRPGLPWLIPVRFDDCDIPDFDIGGGRTLRYLQRVDLFGDHLEEGANRLVGSIHRILRQSDPQT